MLAGALLAACAVTISPTTVVAQQQVSAKEYTLKAAFLYNFMRYVTWPEEAFESASSPFVVGVVGEPPAALRKSLGYYVRKKNVAGRSIKVVYLKDHIGAADCHMVFVRNVLEDDLVAKVAARCANGPVLVVGEADGFLKQTTGICVVPAGRTLEVRLHLTGVAARGFEIDARFLRIARVVP
ncbi:MAG: YfiR family protein [Pirellulaceae bacterium]|nr:YfiR family protein [Pirellulaceae bacterium]